MVSALLLLWACDFAEPDVPVPAPVEEPVPVVEPVPEVAPVPAEEPDPPRPARRSGGGGSSPYKDSISNTVRSYAGQVKYCYESVLKTDPSVDGRLEMGWTIGDDGRTSDVHVVSNGTGSADLATCVAGKIRTWRFPPDTAGDISWPFVLSAKNR